MPLTRFGDTGPVFGLQAETTGFVQDFTVREEYDEAECHNHIGEVVAFGLYNKRWSGSFTLVDKNDAVKPSTAAAVALANCGEASKVVVTASERTPDQKGYQKTKYDFKAFSNITIP